MKYIFRIVRIVRALRSAIIPMAALGYLVISCWSPQGTLDCCDGRIGAVGCPMLVSPGDIGSGDSVQGSLAQTAGRLKGHLLPTK